MVSNWPTVPLRDVATLQKGVSYSGEFLNRPGPLLLGLGAIKPGGGYKTGSTKTYAGPLKEAHRIRPGQMFIALTDLTQEGAVLGSPAIAPAHGEFAITHHVARVEVDASRADTRFVYYALMSPAARQYMRGVASGTTVRQVSLSDARALCLKLPPLEEQRAVAGVLGALDDKIDLNRQMSVTLEEMARAIFKSWFVDFDPVSAMAEGRDPGLPREIASLFPSEFEDSALGPIPAGWTTARLSGLLMECGERVEPSPETAALPYVPIECITSHSLALTARRPGMEARSSLLHFREGNILFGAMRPYFHKVCIAPFDGTTRTTVLVLKPLHAEDAAFAALTMDFPGTVDFATQHSTGSTIPYVTWRDSLGDMPIAMPPWEVRRRFNELVQPFLAAIGRSVFELDALTDLQSVLLPKLVSGELRLPDAEKLLERIGA